MPAGGEPYGGLSAQRVRSLARDLVNRYEALVAGRKCAGVEDLTAEVRSALDALATGSWSIADQTSPTQEWTFPDGRTETVSVPRTSDGQVCAEFAIDATGATVVLVNGWPDLPA